jgi:23S rRNA (pseudouridine1915-N3)-methyltransferase
MKLVFLFTGGQKEDWLLSAAAEYEKKIGFFVSTEIMRLKPSKQARAASELKLKGESDSILKALKPDDYVIVFDERGESLDSIAFSKKVVRAFESGKKRVVMIVGGAYGLSEDVKKRAQWSCSLSKMVMNHHVAQTVLLEQTYRAFTILKNIPYHNE